ncbi:Ephrin_rec_like domain-containing protein [Durusdinium trenchii]|uniref:Ephrin_rec_like domain-containing protein n=1 Tax=Durusdinium trenchii TaxID=1381693 RepID=A0ABP0M3E4_9DINO
MMVLMSLTALVHRAAMGGNQEFAVFNLSRTHNSDVVAKKLKDMAELMAQMDEKELEKALDTLAVFDTRRITKFMTMMAAEVMPDGKDFSFGTRVSSASFSQKAAPATVQGASTWRWS